MPRPPAKTSIYRLADRDLTVRVLEPPLREYAERIQYWWRDVRAMLVSGELAETSLDRFFVGELDGEYVGSMTYATPRDTRDLAILGMVWTRPDRRRQGIATALLLRVLTDFRAGGGVAMYLCTNDPHAFQLYHKAGFRPLVGDGMRYLAPESEAFDETFYAHTGPATVRPGTWGDLARVSALYNQPEPDWLIKDYPRGVYRDIRYERHYIQVWKPASQGRGTVLLLETGQKRVVGIASLIEGDNYYEQHVQTLDFWACPAYLHQIPDLLAALGERASDSSAEIVQAYVAETDTVKRDLLLACGFQREARLRDRLRAGDRRVDLLVFCRSLGQQCPPSRPASSYYGARPAFQEAPGQPDNGGE